MPSEYHADERGNKPFSDFSSVFDQLLFNLPVRVNELTLKHTLDFLKHPAHDAFNLPPCYIFASINEFQYAVNTNRARVLYSLARMVAYDVATHKKTIDEHAKMKALEQDHTIRHRRMQKELTQAEQKLT